MVARLLGLSNGREKRTGLEGMDGGEREELLAASFTSCWMGIHIARPG